MNTSPIFTDRPVEHRLALFRLSYDTYRLFIIEMSETSRSANNEYAIKIRSVHISERDIRDHPLIGRRTCDATVPRCRHDHMPRMSKHMPRVTIFFGLKARLSKEQKYFCHNVIILTNRHRLSRKPCIK